MTRTSTVWPFDQWAHDELHAHYAMRDVLYATLDDLRSEIAHKTGDRPRFIAWDEGLHEMTLLLPTTAAELAPIWGMNAEKIALYGETFLPAIRHFAHSHGLSRSRGAAELAKLVRRLIMHLRSFGDGAKDASTMLCRYDLETTARFLPQTCDELCDLVGPGPLERDGLARAILDATVCHARKVGLCCGPTAIPEEAENAPPLCPDCGEIMTAREGAYGPFWGCITFWDTDCKGKRPYLAEFDAPSDTTPQPTAPAPTDTPSSCANAQTQGGNSPHPPKPTHTSLAADEVCIEWGPLEHSDF